MSTETFNENAVVLTSKLNSYTARISRELQKIATSGQSNVIESISIDGTTQTITNKNVALDLSAYAKKSDISSGISVKGTIASFSALPSNASVGDMYNVTNAGGTDENGVPIKAGDNVVKTATGWDNFGGTIDLSGYVQKDGTKVLSTNDYTTAEKTKLNGIAAGAQVNVIETIQIDGNDVTPNNKVININLGGKADKVSNATAGNFAALDGNGNLTDSGYSVATNADINAILNNVFGDESDGE